MLSICFGKNKYFRQEGRLFSLLLNHHQTNKERFTVITELEREKDNFEV